MKNAMIFIACLTLFSTIVFAQPQPMTQSSLNIQGLDKLPNEYSESTKVLLNKGFMASILSKCDDCDLLKKGNVTAVCSDTDGGLNYTAKGTVSGYLNSSQGYVPFEFTDFCMNTVKGHETSTSLIEFYCKENECHFQHPWFKKVNCDNGCTDGKCKGNEIPEFTLIGMGIAVLGTIAGLFVLRKKK